MFFRYNIGIRQIHSGGKMKNLRQRIRDNKDSIIFVSLFLIYVILTMVDPEVATIH